MDIHLFAEWHDRRYVLPSSYWRRRGKTELRSKVSIHFCHSFVCLLSRSSINVSIHKQIHTFTSLLSDIIIDQSIYPSIYSTNPSIHSGRRVSPQSQRATTCRRQRCGTRCTRSSRQVFPIINRFINQPIHTRNIIMAIKTTILTTIELTKESSFWSGGSFPREVPEHHGQCQRCHGAFKCKWSYTICILHFASNF